MALPPALTGTPNFGPMPIGQPSGNPGRMAQASAGIREALHILTAEVAKLPPGSEPQVAVMECIKKLSKAFPEAEASPGIQKTQALSMAQGAQQGQPMAALMRAMAGAGAGAMGGEAPQPMM